MGIETGAFKFRDVLECNARIVCHLYKRCPQRGVRKHEFEMLLEPGGVGLVEMVCLDDH